MNGLTETSTAGRMSIRKKVIIGVIALVLAVLLGLSFRAAPIPSAIVVVSRGALAETVREEGRTRVRERYDISAPVAAYAPRFELHPGDYIEAGQVLLLLQPLPPVVLDPRSRAEAEARVERSRAALSSAESRLEAARATAELADQEWQRIEPLYQQQTVSRSMLDQTRAAQRRAAAELRSAQYSVEAARQDLRQAEAVLRPPSAGPEQQQVPIIAPVAGRILQVHHESQGVVQPGDSLLCIADPASLEVVIDVLSEDAVRIQPGTRVIFDRWGGGADLDGIVRVVEPGGFTKVSALGVEEQRVRVVADLVSPYAQWEALGDGYRIEARFVTWQGDDVLHVPNGAVFRHGEGWAVFAVSDQRAWLRPVGIGHRGETATEILSGLQAGEQVLNHPDEAVADGVRVVPFADRALP
ncbi:MAG: HlyD family efflux transporter periplasmic adaptor subunit [Wenzhouxiangellaceae bacterium]